MQIRLLKTVKGSKDIPVTIDGIEKNLPFSNDNDGFEIIRIGKELVFTTNFGLTVIWDGKTAVNVRLCDSYAGSVCGLCGTGTKDANSYLDRNDKPIELVGTKYTKFFEWGSKWRTNDDSIDADPELCDPLKSPGPNVGPTCVDPSIYKANKWCGTLSDPSGIFKECVKVLIETN